MTTYVLHGGATSKDDPRNDAFFAQFTSLVDKASVKVLMCYWSRPEERWAELLDRDSKKVLVQTDKDVEMSIVSDPDDLRYRMGEYDVLYVAGGDAEPIEKYYSALNDLRKALEGKVYVGSSMGAFMAARHYVLSYDSQDTQTIHDGLGLVSLSNLCHWNVENEKERKLQLLREKDPTLPILLLDEYETVKILG